MTRRSGKSLVAVRRLAYRNRFRDAVHHWAAAATQRDPVSKAKHSALRARGHGHAHALRSVADRLPGVTRTMLENRTLLNPDIRSRSRAA